MIMSKIEFSTDGTKGRIKDVVLCYVKMQDGSFKYQSTTEKEYTVDCVVDKATAKAFKKSFPKNGYKEVDTADFNNIYKIDPPLPENDEQFLIKLKTNADMKSDVPKHNLKVGDTVPYKWSTRPKVYLPVNGGVSDITMSKLISNGSVGDVAFNITENTFGKFPKLTGILVTDLIEYTQQEEGFSEFGEVVGGYNPGDGEEMGQRATSNENDSSPNGPNEPMQNDNYEGYDNPDDIPF